MNYFLETNSEAISLRQRTSEQTSKHLCSFAAVNALAAVVCCEALNSNCLSQTMATQELEPEAPGTQDWLALRDQEEAVAISHSCLRCDTQVPIAISMCRKCNEAIGLLRERRDLQW